MRVTQNEMESHHQQIVHGASQMLRERGIRNTSVADAMNAAGMTHGGFYRHFKAKDDLVIEALRAAFDEFALPLESLPDIESPADVAAQYKALYLSNEHVVNPKLGCPMPAVGSDLARESPEVKAEFTRGFRRVAQALANAKGTTETGAMKELAMLVGAVVLARACDGNAANEVLDACRSED